MATKQRPKTNIAKKPASTKRNHEPEEDNPTSGPKRSIRPSRPLVVALVGAVTTALVLFTALIKAGEHAPKRAPCPCICPKA